MTSFRGGQSVTQWKPHLPQKVGRCDTASRKGLVSTCRSAGSCLNWCSISRAISPVLTQSNYCEDGKALSILCEERRDSGGPLHVPHAQSTYTHMQARARTHKQTKTSPKINPDSGVISGQQLMCLTRH